MPLRRLSKPVRTIAASRRRPLRFEGLERRSLLATFTVTNTLDNDGIDPEPLEGTGTLRQAMIDATASPGPDEIHFNIPGSGPHKIAPVSPLPNLPSEVIIDGTTQPGYEANGLHPIELSGENQPQGCHLGRGFDGGSNSTIRGLTMYRWDAAIAGGFGNRIESNYFGLQADRTPLPYSQSDFSDPTDCNLAAILLNGTGNIIGGPSPDQGNVIGDYRIEGGGTQNRILNNTILDNAAILVRNGQQNHIGEPGAGNTIYGHLYFDSGAKFNSVQGNSLTTVELVHPGTDNNLFGGGGPGEGNHISASFSVWMGAHNKIQGNTVSSDIGLQDSQGNVVGSDADGINDATEGNIIRGGIGINGSHSNAVRNNFIGIDPAGNVIRSAGSPYGINIVNSSNNIVEANTISGGYNPAIYVNGNSQDNLIGNNELGLSPAGNIPAVPNVRGIILSDFDIFGGQGSASNNQVVGNEVTQSSLQGIVIRASSNVLTGNTISDNGAAGILVSSGQGNTISANSIYSNDGLGINLNTNATWHIEDGVNGNDVGDGDEGANRSQNFPVLSYAASAPTATHIQAALNSKPNTSFTIDVYANETADSTGHGEGQRWLGSKTIATDANGNWTGAFSVSATVAGEFITATATDSGGNTSEFALALESVRAVTNVAIDVQADSLNLNGNSQLTVIVFGAPDFDAATIDVASVRFAGASASQSSLVDADSDGHLDLRLKFSAQDTVLEQIYAQLLIDDHDADDILDSTHQTAEVSLTGETTTDEILAGSDDLTLFLAGRKLRDLLNQLFG